MQLLMKTTMNMYLRETDGYNIWYYIFGGDVYIMCHVVMRFMIVCVGPDVRFSSRLSTPQLFRLNGPSEIRSKRNFKKKSFCKLFYMDGHEDCKKH